MYAPEIRQRVVDACVLLSRQGYFAATGGNLAVRIDAAHFAVTPSATDYLTMTAADICVVRVADLARTEGERAPSVETGLHARVLLRRPDVGCSIHTHQPVASACALLGGIIAADAPEVEASLGKVIPLIGYMPSGTGVLSAMVGRAVRPGINAYLMRNHGVLCCGSNIEAAIGAVEQLERLSRRHLRKLIAARADAEPSFAAALLDVITTLEAA